MAAAPQSLPMTVNMAALQLPTAAPAVDQPYGQSPFNPWAESRGSRRVGPHLPLCQPQMAAAGPSQPQEPAILRPEAHSQVPVGTVPALAEGTMALAGGWQPQVPAPAWFQPQLPPQPQPQPLPLSDPYLQPPQLPLAQPQAQFAHPWLPALPLTPAQFIQFTNSLPRRMARDPRLNLAEFTRLLGSSNRVTRRQRRRRQQAAHA
jgi:hypothetical protein